MKMNEYKKLAKISDELITFALCYGCQRVCISISIEDDFTKLELKVSGFEQKIRDDFYKELSKGRNVSLEEFGWELLGESETNDEIALVGMLFDDVKMNVEEEFTIYTLIRKN